MNSRPPGGARVFAAGLCFAVQLAAGTAAWSKDVRNRWGGATVRTETAYTDGVMTREAEYDGEGTLRRLVERYPASFLAEEPVVLSEYYFGPEGLERIERYFTNEFMALSGGCYKEVIFCKAAAPVRRILKYQDGRELERDF